ncbi:hypothetical protein ACO22_03318 [Paracoccidioides brasiliensis]|uniref:Uncharacterized protein n=1 Tax=Paracoccidioides brasiliensis TaxID=121759 RepID=A0A1D2JGF5_PARBR|nr:hypothetical protein ACO22_03318 [Paracoccidioides brasiliensis]
MEAVHEYIIPVLQNASKYIPPSVSLQALSYYSTFNTHFHTVQQEYLQPYVISPLYTLINSPPDLPSVLILCVILYLSLRILDYARRIIAFWVVLLFRLVFWGSILGGGYYVYVVGFEKASRDVGWLLGVLEGFIEEFVASSWDGKPAGADGASPIYWRTRREQGRKRTSWI